MPAFAYLGDHAETEVFGLLFPVNEPVEVTDPRAVRKLRNNAHFVECFDGVQVLDEPAKKRGRPPKAT